MDLLAHVFRPAGENREPLPAVALFHGGGWFMGEAAWTFPRAERYAGMGMVSVAVQYRLSDEKGVTPLEAMADARNLIRWMRTHAESLRIDPDRIAAFGWSAGAHLALSAALFPDTTGGVDSSPDAFLMLSPAVSLEEDAWLQKLLGDRARAAEISPDRHVRPGLAPCLILQGDVDTVTPLAGVRGFVERMKAAGNECEIVVYEGFGHLFTPAGIRDDGMPQPDPEVSRDAAVRADRFLEAHGWTAAISPR
jgi:acetyl esterase/lipase